MNRLTRKMVKAMALVKNRQYFQFFSLLCANCLPANSINLGKLYLMTFDVTEIPEETSAGEYVVRRVGEEHLEAIMESSENHSGMGSHALFEDYFRAGHTCYVIEEGKTILGYLWVFAEKYLMTFGDGEEHGITVKFPSSLVFVGNVFVNPARRRQGLYRRLLRGMAIDESRYRGIREIVAVVKASNSTSVNAHHRNSFITASTVYRISLPFLAFLVVLPARSRQWCRITKNRSLEVEYLCGSVSEE